MILVTGGTGLVGAYLLFYLSHNNDVVRATYRHEHRKSIVKFVFKHLAAFEGRPTQDVDALYNKIEWIRAEMDDIVALEEAMEEVTEVYHTSAIVSFNRSLKEEIFKVNIEGTANMVNLSIEKGVQKFGYVSSTAALGSIADTPIDENIADLKSFGSAYTESKYRAEMEVWRGIAEGLPAVIINPSIILGWGDFERGSIEIIHKVAEGFRFYTAGGNGFIDARDVAQSLISLMSIQEAIGQRYVASAYNISYEELFHAIAAELGQKPPGIRTGPFFGGLVALAAEGLAFISRTEPFLTRELAKKANKQFVYTSEKLLKTTERGFIPFERSINEISIAYKDWLKGNFLEQPNVGN